MNTDFNLTEEQLKIIADRKVIEIKKYLKAQSDGLKNKAQIELNDNKNIAEAIQFQIEHITLPDNYKLELKQNLVSRQPPVITCATAFEWDIVKNVLESKYFFEKLVTIEVLVLSLYLITPTGKITIGIQPIQSVNVSKRQAYPVFWAAGYFNRAYKVLKTLVNKIIVKQEKAILNNKRELCDFESFYTGDVRDTIDYAEEF